MYSNVYTQCSKVGGNSQFHLQYQPFNNTDNYNKFGVGLYSRSITVLCYTLTTDTMML